MAGLDALLERLGAEVDSLEEEYFSVFSEDIPSQSLGGVDPRAACVELLVNDRDLTIHQSPSILNSSRAGGTTGAVVWKVTPFFAAWISGPDSFLIKSGILSPSAAVLELGCGISGIIALCLGPLVASYTLTDQSYVLKLLNQNLLENTPIQKGPGKGRGGSKSKKYTSAVPPPPATSNISFQQLDWELDSAAALPSTYDVVLACDCIYNDALIPPLISTLVDVCLLRQEAIANLSTTDDVPSPTLVVVAQQRRSSEVFEDWLVAFHARFRTWRVPDELLSEQLRAGSGYLVHVGILRLAAQ